MLTTEVSLCNYLHCSQALQNGNVQLARSQNQLKLVVSPTPWPKQLDVPLREASPDDVRHEMSTLLFTLWDRLNAATTKLQGAVLNNNVQLRMHSYK